MPEEMTYAKAGVSIEREELAIRKIKGIIEKTSRKGLSSLYPVVWHSLRSATLESNLNFIQEFKRRCPRR